MEWKRCWKAMCIPLAEGTAFSPPEASCFMMSLYVSSEICLWRLWDLSCFQILSMNLGSTQTTVGAANRFGVGFSPGRTHVSGNARGNVSRVVTWLMIGCLVELRLDLFYIEIRIVTLCNLICLEFIVCKCRFCSEFVSLSICVASCTKSCRCPFHIIV